MMLLVVVTFDDGYNNGNSVVNEQITMEHTSPFGVRLECQTLPNS